MEIRPKVEFPEQYDEIYYPGRKIAWWVVYFAGAWFAVLGAVGVYYALTSPPPGTTPAAGVLFCALFVAVGTALIVYVAMAKGRTAVALTAEGLYYRNWLNRVWHLPWSNFEEVSIHELFYRGDSVVGGTQEEIACLSGRFVPGGKTRVRIVISSRLRLREAKDIQADRMVSAIIARAGLVPGPARRGRRTWVRARAGERPSPQMNANELP